MRSKISKCLVSLLTFAFSVAFIVFQKKTFISLISDSKDENISESITISDKRPYRLFDFSGYDEYDLKTTVLMAGFSFDCYNDPIDVKWDFHKGGSRLAFTSEDFVRESFSGVLSLTVQRIQPSKLPLMPPSHFPSKVSFFLEGKSITSSVVETPTKSSGDSWGDSFLIYVYNSENVDLHVLLEKSESPFHDGKIGFTKSVKLTKLMPSLIQNSKEDHGIVDWNGWLELEPENKDTKEKNVKIEVGLQYIPFHYDPNENSNSECENKASKEYDYDEKLGGTPDIDWKQLIKKVSDEQNNTLPFERIAFIDDSESDTQCAIWRDTANKRLTVAFRGTSNWKDLLTDAMLIQEPLFEELQPIKPGTTRWEVAKNQDRRSTPSKLLASLLSSVSREQANFDLRSSISSASVNFKNLGEILSETVEMAKNASLGKNATDLINLLQNAEIASEKISQVFSLLSTNTTKGSLSPERLQLSSMMEIAGLREALEGIDNVTKSLPSGTSSLLQLISELNTSDDMKNSLSQTKQFQNMVRQIVYPYNSEGVPLIHSGFKKAYLGIRSALVDVIKVATKSDSAEKWKIYLTGHSLGGALATLASFDLSREGIGGRMPASISMYNFGSPRVGNRVFAEMYNELNRDSFRIASTKDIVTSLPRKIVAALIGNYEHVGRTVILDHLGIAGKKWVEGVDGGICPIEEIELHDTSVGAVRIKMLQEILAGEGILNHREESYFEKMRQVLESY